MKGGLSKEVVSDEGGVSMGHSTFVTSTAGLTREVVFHEGGLSKRAPLYSMCQDEVNTKWRNKYSTNETGLN